MAMCELCEHYKEQAEYFEERYRSVNFIAEEQHKTLGDMREQLNYHKSRGTLKRVAVKNINPHMKVVR